MEKIWQQQSNESSKAYAGFRCFLELGKERTISDAYRQKTGRLEAKQPPGCWNSWAKQFDWETRARAFDEWVDSQREQKFLDAWEARRDRLLEQAFRLSERADQMLKHPLIEQRIEKTVTTKSGEQIPVLTIIKPSRWAFSDIPKSYMVASDLMRLAVGDVDLAIELLERNGYEVVLKREE